MKRSSFRRLCVERLESRQMLVFDPTGAEQELLEAINRMRMNPQGELAIIYTNLATLTSSDPDVTSASRAFGVNPTQLQSEFNALTAVAPLAWNSALSDAAEGHSAQMIAQRSQSHQLPGEPALGTRATNAGYTNWSSLGENIFAYAENAFHAHAGFVVDWGNNPPGHRQNIMSPTWKEVGIDATPHTPVSGSDVGPLVVTQDFGTRFSSGNSFLLGVVYRDNNSNTRYTAGEGLAGVTITATPVGGGAAFTTTTMTAGGYQLQLPNGSYVVTASGGALGTARSGGTITVSSANRKLDFDANVAVAANLAPVNTVPNHQATRPNTSVVFNAANGNQISVADPDAGASSVRVTLSVTAGSLTLSGLAGLSFSSGDGTADGSMTFSGSVANINAALQGMVFTPPNGYVGGASQLTITTNDLGNTGAGGALTDTDSLFIYVSNDFALAGNNLWTIGTSGADDFWITFSDANNFSVVLNGVQRNYNLSTVSQMTVYLGGGADTVRITLAPGSDQVYLNPREFQVFGVGYQIYASGGDTQYVWATGNQGLVFFGDSAGDDTFNGNGANATMSGPGYFNQILNLTTFYVLGSGAGNDAAFLYDSTANDSLYRLPDFTQLSGTGMFQYVANFDRVYAYSTAGGTDNAYLYDSTGVDSFFGQPGNAQLYGSGYLVQALQFENMYGYSYFGGADVASLYDSEVDNYFYALADSAAMTGTGYFVQTFSFDIVVGYASTGTDRAVFYDSPGNDTFTRTTSSVNMLGSGFNNSSVGFEIVIATSQSGIDTASLYDSSGNDSLVTGGNNATLTVPGVVVYVYGFRNVVAVANAGGRNTISRGSISYVLTTSGNWTAA